MERSRTPELVAGIVLVIIGTAYLAAYIVPELGRFVVLAIGIGILVLYAATRAPAALIAGCIVTGVGAGIVLASYIEGQAGGGWFLVSLGGGFLLAWFIGRFLAVEETRVWPLIPGMILVLVGAALLPGAGWAVALIAIGLGFVVAGLGSRSANGTSSRVPRWMPDGWGWSNPAAAPPAAPPAIPVPPAAPPRAPLADAPGADSGDGAGLAEAPQVRDDVPAHDLQAPHVPDVADADDRVV